MNIRLFKQVKNVSAVFTADKTKEAVENNPMDFQSMLEERISKTMVGRGAQTEMFKKQFDRVLEGGMGLTIVSGRPGIGKSFFTEHRLAEAQPTSAANSGNMTKVR